MQDAGFRGQDAGYRMQVSGAGMKSYRDLDIYQSSHGLAVKLHAFSLQLPKYEMFETGSQLRRASKSVSANIVEGYGRRRYKAEFVRFLVFAHASCDETHEWLEYIKDNHRSVAGIAEAYLEECRLLGRKISEFISAVEQKHLTGSNVQTDED